MSLVGYALVTGLAYSAAKKVMQNGDHRRHQGRGRRRKSRRRRRPRRWTRRRRRVAPPPKINVAPAPPQIQTVTDAAAAGAGHRARRRRRRLRRRRRRPRPAARAEPKGSPGSWATTERLSGARACAKRREGTTGFRVSVGPDGRVTDCSDHQFERHRAISTRRPATTSRAAPGSSPALDDDGSPTGELFQPRPLGDSERSISTSSARLTAPASQLSS